MKTLLILIPFTFFAQVTFAASTIKPEMQEDSLKSVTHCVGRFLVDLPETARYTGGRFSHAYTEIEVEPKTLDAFHKEVIHAEREMEGLKHGDSSPLLVDVLRPTDDSSVLAHWKHETSIQAIVDGYRWLNGKRYRFRRVVTGRKIQEGTRWMTDFITRVRPLDGTIPTARGFCIPGAIILDDENAYPESAVFYFEFDDKRDITLDINTDVNEGAPPESLLSRKPGVFSALGILGAVFGGLRTISEGDRNIGNMAGQQWLITAPNDRGHRGHLFTWETPGAKQEILLPQVRIDLESAKYGQGVEPGPASLNDKEMLKLWDRILDTFRLRPADKSSNASSDTGPSSSSPSSARPLPL